MKKILLVEDDRTLSNGIVLALKTEDTGFEQCYDLASAKTFLSKESYDLIILDLNLPDGNGLDLLHTFKHNMKCIGTPIVILTANDLETDIITGLEMGADDYITKPFSLAVLRARINAQLRKQNNMSTGYYEYNHFIFDFDKMLYYKSGNLIELSKVEQKLLKILVENRNQTLTRSLLVDRIWTDNASFVEENALSVTIKRLRDKLEINPSKPQYIKTVYGIGYTWQVM